MSSRNPRIGLALGGGAARGWAHTGVIRVVDFFRARFEDRGIEHLPRRFGCVATELTTGREVWLREGSVIDAVSRLAGEPPDVLTRPHLGGIVAMDFHRGAAASAEGERAAAAGIAQLRALPA